MSSSDGRSSNRPSLVGHIPCDDSLTRKYLSDTLDEAMVELPADPSEQQRTSAHNSSDFVKLTDSTKDMMQRSIAERLERAKIRVSSTISRIFPGSSRHQQRQQTVSIFDGKSFEEVHNVLRRLPQPPTSQLIAADGVQLAYRHWPTRRLPCRAIYVMLILNQPFLVRTARAMAEEHPIDFYGVFPRGFGPSSGKRGFSPRYDQYFEDFALFIRWLRKNRPGIPIIIGGCEISGLIALRFLKSAFVEPVDGFLVVNLFFSGVLQSSISHDSSTMNATVDRFRLLLAKWTHGALFGQSKVIRIDANNRYYRIIPNFSPYIYGILAAMYVMKKPQKRIPKDLPFMLLFGEDDELVDYRKAIPYFTKAVARNPANRMQVVDMGNLMNMSLVCWQPVAQWIMEVLLPTLQDKDFGQRRDPEDRRVFVEAEKDAWMSYVPFVPKKTSAQHSHCSLIYFGDEPDGVLQELADEYSLQVLAFDLAVPRPAKTGSLLPRIRKIVQTVKANWPAEPVVVGGEGAYAGWIARLLLEDPSIKVNGFLAVNPKPEPGPYCRGSGAILGSALLGAEGEFPGIEATLKSLNCPFVVLYAKDCAYADTGRIQDRFTGEFDGHFKQVAVVESQGRLFAEQLPLIGAWMCGIMSLTVGQTLTDSLGPNLSLADFELMDMLGAGSFGKVFLVKHNERNTYYALKVLDKQMIIDRHQELPVMNEKAALSESKQSPFIVTFQGSFQDRTRLFILMEYMIGGEIYRLLQEKRRFPEEWARFYAAEVLLALEFLHHHKLAYRDLKSENILLDQLGHVRLVDFGFAKHYSPQQPLRTFCGSPYYLAPEIIRGVQSYGPECDYWSFGVWIYEMLTGKMPFGGTTQNSIYRQVLAGQPDFSSAAGLSPEATSILQQLLQKDPKKRLGFQGPHEVKSHEWFGGIDWARLESRQLTPPFQPAYTYAGDTNNFQVPHPESLDPMQPQAGNGHGDVFKDF